MPLSLRERQLALLVALVRQRQRQEAEAAAPAHGGAAPAAAEQQAAEAQAAGLQAAHEQLLYYKQRVALLQAQCAEAGSPSPAGERVGPLRDMYETCTHHVQCSQITGLDL